MSSRNAQLPPQMFPFCQAVGRYCDPALHDRCVPAPQPLLIRFGPAFPGGGDCMHATARSSDKQVLSPFPNCAPSLAFPLHARSPCFPCASREDEAVRRSSPRNQVYLIVFEIPSGKMAAVTCNRALSAGRISVLFSLSSPNDLAAFTRACPRALFFPSLLLLSLFFFSGCSPRR